MQLYKISSPTGNEKSCNTVKYFRTEDKISSSMAATAPNSYEDIRLKESDCEESEENGDIIDNIPVSPDIYVARDGTEWIPYNSNVPGRLATRNALRQSSNLTSFTKHNVNVNFLEYKGS
ncbi:uncharacterized protein TNCV_3864551 [Trichonephila clavipes]|nr:uncharacterized protein TNCV_3864551 [Trichonephila clavipes]